MYKQTLPLFLCIFLSACDLIDYHPYDGRLTISERDINDHNIPLIEAATKDKDTIRFVLMGDTQRSYDETEDFVKHINTKKDSIDFIIHGGDYTEFGMKKEYEWTVNILSKLDIPYVGFDVPLLAPLTVCALFTIIFLGWGSKPKSCLIIWYNIL